MAHIPAGVLARQGTISQLKKRSTGKVRDSYDLPGHPDMMMPVASNRCSIFDFVLNTEIPFKGQILTALSCFWVNEVISSICETDLIAFGSGIDPYLPEGLRDNRDLQKHATIVKIVDPPEVEDIVRLYLTGSGWKSYQKDGTVCGHRLPPGLIDGSKLPFPIYTPTTKASVGHDEHISADSVSKRYGIQRERSSLQVAEAISSHAEKSRIIMADTKFEFNRLLVDEKATPDSSRFWDANAWKKAHAKGKLPPSFDKEFVRDYGKKLGIDKRDPANPDDLAYVDALEVPESIVDMTTRIYRNIFWRLTGMKIENYQRTKMGIRVESARPKIEVIIGSTTDLNQTVAGLEWLRGKADVRLNILSCHRNPVELRAFARNGLSEADVCIAGAGMAAALPGMIKTELCLTGRPEIPVIGTAFKGETEEHDLAAKLSIKCLPGQPVELDPNGEAYFGHEGFLNACKAAVEHEFLPRTIESKPAQIGRPVG